MAKRKQSAEDRVNSLEQVLIDIWHEAQECDGSRGEQQAALDSIQALIEVEMPDVAEYEPTDAPDDGEENIDYDTTSDNDEE